MGGELQKAPHGGLGRWPANVILDEKAGEMLDEQSGITQSNKTTKSDNRYSGNMWEKSSRKPENSHNDRGGASRFFYCSKASSSERNRGLEGIPLKENMRVNATRLNEEYNKMNNFHPIVKPLKLMEYLIKLVAPKDGIILDPFCGSGTTIVAAKKLGYNAIGIELNPEYCDIAKGRVETQECQMEMPL